LIKFDTIIIGAGHNGLVCASYLAKAGQKVLVLEAAETLGGLARTREFYPGFRVSVAHSLSHFSSKVVSDLKLGEHGYKLSSPLRTVGLGENGEHVILEHGVVSGVSENDVKVYANYREQLQRFANVLKPAWHKTIPRIGDTSLPALSTLAQIALKLRLLGKEEMGEFMRVVALPARDLMDENFENELLKAVLSWDGLTGNKMAPRSPNSTVLNMLYRMSGENGGDHAVPAGGIDGLIAALVSAAEKAGALIRTGAQVGKILVEAGETGLKATGVELTGGDKVAAERVVSAADPKRTLLELVGTRNLEIEFTNRIRRIRSDGLVAKLHLALDGMPDFKGLEAPEGRLIIAPDMDALEFSFDHSKYGEVPEDPVMEIMIPSLYERSLAPRGKHVLSAHVMYVPYKLKDGWSDKARKQLGDKIVKIIGRYAPGVKDQILHQEVLTPVDIEATFNVTSGHWSHGDFAIDQMMMMRPTYQAAQYSTPLPGLYLCSAGSHPGGDLTGIPGHNAAREILK